MVKMGVRAPEATLGWKEVTHHSHTCPLKFSRPLNS